MTLGRGEPEFGPWVVRTCAELVRWLLSTDHAQGPVPILGVDGRSSSGKTTLADRINRVVASGRVVHTDDLAWRHSRFGWTDLLINGVLNPLHRGQAVSYRPPAWDRHGRPGSIDIPQDAALVVIEGVGVARAELAPLMNASVWVQADLRDVERRNAARVRSGETSGAGVTGWMAEEFPFLEAERPWRRASLITAGSNVLAHDAEHEVVISGHRIFT
jgi:hypothetical protein